MEPVRIEFLMVDKMSARLDASGRKVDELKGKAREASSAMGGLDAAAEQARRTIGRLAGAFAAKELVSKIANVRGEFQQLEVAFRTMLGSAEQADALMAQLTRTAATTPFGLQEVANGAKQLLAYGTEAEKVNETLVRLGDIAAGLSVPLGDLVYLYGTTMAQGRLYTQDLNQFTGRGIPMIQELAKQFGVAESKVKGLVEEGKVGFPEVQKVIESLTNSGGKFGGLMEAQSKTIAGQINNIEDSIEGMFNKIGQENEGLINDTLGAVSSLVENYEKVAMEVLALAGVYGTYKAVVITLSAIEKARLTLTLSIGAAEKTVTAAQAIRFAMTNKLKAAQEALNATMAKNPYTLVAAAVAALAYGIYKLATYQTDAEKAQRRLDDATKDYNKSMAAEQLQIDGLFARLQNAKKGTQEYENAKDSIISQYGTYLNGLDAEIRSLNDVEAAYKAVSAAARDAAKARAMESFTKDAADTYASVESDEKEKLYQYLKKHYKGQKTKGGRDKAESIYWQLVGAINGNGKEVNESWLKQFDATHTVTSPSTGIAAYSYTTNEVHDILNRIKGAKTTYNKSMDEARRRFGDTPEEEEKKKTTTTPTTQDYDYWAQKKKEAESQLKALDVSKKGSKEWNKLLKEKREAEQKMAEFDGTGTGTSSPHGASSAEKAAEKAAAKAGETARALERENQEAEIALMEEGREKKLAQIGREYEDRKAEIEKKAHDLAEANKKAGETNVNGNGLTAAQQAEIDKANALNEKNKAKQESDLARADAEAMREYLKQYGTYQQQKLAIAEEYAEKIKKAETEGERLALQAGRERELQRVEVEAVKRSVDWGSVFGDFGAMFKDQLQPTIDKLRAIAGSDSFRESPLEDQQALYELISKLEQSGAAWDSDIFRKVSADITAYQSAMQGYTAAVEREKKASDELAAAKERLAAAERSGEGKDAAQAAVEAAHVALDAASADVRDFGGQVTETTESLQSSGEKARSMFESLESGLSGLASGSLKGVGNGVMTLDKLFGGKVTETAGNALAKGFQSLLGKGSAAAAALNEALGESGMAGEIIGAVLGVLDLIAEEGLSGIITGLEDTVLGSVDKILDDVLSGDIVAKPLKSAVDHVGSLLDTVTFGGFSSWIDTGNGKDVARTIERLTERNEELVTAMDDLRDTIANQKGMTTEEKSESYAQAVENQKEVNANYLEMAKAQAGYHGSHHSWNKYWDGFTDDETEWIRKNVRSDFDGDLFSLSPEEMKKLRSNVGIWDRIESTGKGGYGERLTDKLDDYIDQAYAIDELTEEWAEELTGVSFDDLYDSWVSTLADMDADASDFADDFSEYMFKAMLQTWTNDNLKSQLQDWHDAWAEMSKDGLSDAERKILKEGGTWTSADGSKTLTVVGTDEMASSSLAARDSIADATGYTGGSSGTSQTGKSGGFTAMTQDQGTKLEGMFTSGLQHWSSMDARLEDVAAKMDLAEGHLAKIEENTGLGASHLSEIKEDLKKVIRDGLKMK